MLLPLAPATATLDGNDQVQLLWQPPAINGSWEDYGTWSIFTADPTTLPGGGGNLVASAITGLLSQVNPETSLTITGTPDSRSLIFTANPNVSGGLALTMNAFVSVQAAADGYSDPTSGNGLPWATLAGSPFRVFPSPRSLTTDQASGAVDIGQPILITLGDPTDAGHPGDRWMVVYSDGTTSNWMPMSITSTAKAFQRPTPASSATSNGLDTITIVIESDYTSVQPPVYLRREVSTSILVLNQQYTATVSSGGGNQAGNQIGIGGLTGFDVLNNLGDNQTLLSFLAFMNAVVQDSETNELKLLVATTRNQGASSLLGTMAVDVFPLPGRPHSLEMVQFPDLTMSATGPSYSPVSINIGTPIYDFYIGHPVGWNVLAGANQMVQGITFQATGGLPPYRWYATDLPAGLKLSQEGILTGNPSALGLYNFNLSVQDSQTPPFTAGATLSINVQSDLSVVAKQTLPAAVVGVPYTGAQGAVQLSASGGIPPYIWSLTGNLPQGLSITPAGVISGLPTSWNSTSDFDTPYTFMAQVVDMVGALAAAVQTIVLKPTALSLLPPDQPFVVAGQASKLKWPIIGGNAPYHIVSPTDGTVTLNNGFLEMYVSPDDTKANLQIMLVIEDTPVQGQLAAQASGNYTIPVMLPANGAAPSWGQPSLFGVVLASAPQVVTLWGGLAGGVTVSAENLIPTPPNVTSAKAASGAVTFSAPVAGNNTETMLSATFSQGSLVIGVTSREYSVLSALTDATSGVKSWTVSPYPIPFGAFFVLDPQAPTFNSAPPLVQITNQTMRVKPGSGLPTGVALNASTGMLYGSCLDAVQPTPSVLELVDVTGNILELVTIRWNFQPKAKLTASSPTSALSTATGTPFSTSWTIGSATGALTWTILHGRIPQGLSFSSPNNGQLVLSGNSIEYGYFDVWVDVADTIGSHVMIYFRLFVDFVPALNILTGSSLPSAIVTQPYSQSLSARGGYAPYSWAVAAGAPALPSWLTLSTAGLLGGTAPNAAGTVSTSFTVTDAKGNTSTETVSLLITEPMALVINTTSLPSGTKGVSYTASIQASGGISTGTNPYSYAMSNAPSGLSINSVTGAITGIPTVPMTSGSITVTVTDIRGSSFAVSTQIPLIIHDVGALVVTLPGGALPQAIKSVAMTPYQVGAAGGVSPYQNYLATGLPPGLSMSSTGLITGTPTSSGPFTVGITVQDSTAPTPLTSTPQTWTMQVVNNNAPTWTTTQGDVPAGYLNNAFSLQLAAHNSNGTALNYGVAGTTGFPGSSSNGLPSGISISSSGLISGTTNSAFSGPVTFCAVSQADTTAYSFLTLNLTFSGSVTITTPATLPPAVSGKAYSMQLVAGNGLAPYTWALQAGSTLPSGLSFSTSGLLSGTGPVAGTITFSVRATDSNGTVSPAVTFSLYTSVSGISTIPATIAFTVPQNQPFTSGNSIVVTGGSGNFQYAIGSGSLPSNNWSLSPTGQGVAFVRTTNVTESANTYSCTLNVIDNGNGGAISSFPVTITITSASYTWKSGPQAALGAWSAHTDPVAGIPIAVMSALAPATAANNNIAPGYGTGNPWIVSVGGIFNSATPGMSITGSPAGTTWSCTMLTAPTPNQSGASATFKITPDNPVNLAAVGGTPSDAPSDCIVLPAVLNDGTVTAKCNLVVYIRPTNAVPPSNFVGGAAFFDSTGTVLTTSTYS